MAADYSKWMTVAQAAEYMGYKESYVRKLAEECRLPYYKPGKCIRFKRSDLDDYFEAAKVVPITR